MNTFTVIFFITLTASYAVQFWLSKRQIDFVDLHSDQVPDAFKSSVTLEEHQTAARYTIEKERIGIYDSIIGIVFLLVFTVGGGISWMFELWAGFDLSPVITGIGAFISLLIIMQVLELPMSYYHTFVLEDKYGFNKSTPIQFFKDQGMNIGLMLAIGLPLLALILWVMESIGSSWWLWAWAILMSFSLLMSWLFPTVIAPLFNEFTPLEEGDLKNKVNELLTRCGFNSDGIFIMDGSRRSGHGNAYFTGMGKNKRIVFFDTLVESLEIDELESVLAHELGHFKHKHVIKMMVATSITTLISFAILGWLINADWFYAGLGVSEVAQSNASALLLFMLVSPVFTTFMTPISAHFQRKFEFEADAFAAEHAQASKLISGLVRLYRENANTLTPDPLYSAFHYSHPPAAVRIAHLEINMPNSE